MPLPRALARFNKYVTNRIEGLFAGVVPGWGVLEHVGRKSGRTYRTPLNVYAKPGGFVVLVLYGTDSDWLKNVLATGGGGMQYRRTQYTLSDPRLESGSAAVAQLPVAGRILRRTGRSRDVLVLAAEPR